MKKLSTVELSYKEAAALLKIEIFKRSKNIKTFCEEHGYTYNEVTNITAPGSKRKYPILLRDLLKAFGYNIMDNDNVYLSLDKREFADLEARINQLKLTDDE